MNEFKMIPVETHYLYLKERTEFTFESLGHLERAINIPIHDYLTIYKDVGLEWGWSGRLILEEEELLQKIHHPKNYIFYYYLENKVAGFLEFVEHEQKSFEIVYFGLRSEFIGKGIGKSFMFSCLNTVWDQGANEIWLHTCEFDHPQALAFYQKMGFVVESERIDVEPYPITFLEKNNIVR